MRTCHVLPLVAIGVLKLLNKSRSDNVKSWGSGFGNVNHGNLSAFALSLSRRVLDRATLLASGW
jgi:hypothetical protein